MCKIIDEKRKNKILLLLDEDFYKPMNIEDMANFLEVPKKDLKDFKYFINNLISEGEILLNKKNKLISPKKENLLKGVFQSNKNGFGFVILEDKEKKDIFIPPIYTNGALNGDIVFCKILSKNKEKTEGKIVSILKRNINSIVGTFEKHKGFGFVIVDNPKIYFDIFIPGKNAYNIKNNSKVVVEITKNCENKKNPEGKIVEVLGDKDKEGIDILSIVRQYNIPIEFPKEIYNDLENIKETLEEKDLINREDLRNLQMITIDGEDAKDLDDAISLEILENNNYRLGVHIADVSHYVKENSLLDKEALKRGTSVYLVDRVIPMLPKELSNGLCSLNAKEDRLSLSCIMEINEKGKVVSHKVVEGVINVDKRFSYKEVDKILNKENDFHKKNEKFLSMIKNMEKLSNILKKCREERGSIEFDFKETKVKLDEKGNPIDVYVYERKTSMGIIEEFMLICNETIAKEYYHLNIPFVYRTHEHPDSEKIEKLSKFLENFGYNSRLNYEKPKKIQKIIKNFKNTQEEMIINKFILTSLKQAKYTSINSGHYGLAAKYYCHFTSPIRRYPDLQIHRIIKEKIRGKLSEKNICHYKKIIDNVCVKSSITERTAEEIEREVINLKKVQYMKNRLGEVFEGIISSVTSWGIYVELENTIEGMVPISELTGDYYVFVEDKLMFMGVNSKKKYKIGDKVLVKLVKANLEIRKLDFIFWEGDF